MLLGFCFHQIIRNLLLRGDLIKKSGKKVCLCLFLQRLIVPGIHCLISYIDRKDGNKESYHCYYDPYKYALHIAIGGMNFIIHIALGDNGSDRKPGISHRIINHHPFLACHGTVCIACIAVFQITLRPCFGCCRYPYIIRIKNIIPRRQHFSS